MAKANNETVRLRPNTIDENRAVLLEVQSRKLVDARKQDELNALFDRINAECASKSLQERRKALASSDNLCEIPKPVHYGPQPGVSSGKWWGIRMDCSRDGIHEPFKENVHNGPYGAVSICTSHLNSHNDVDLGNFLTLTTRAYSATDRAKDSLILSYKNQVPLRLVRSYCLLNDFAPKTGYRYDGLYTVVDYWVGVSFDQSKHRKFALVRVADQETPPWDERELKGARKKKVILSGPTKSSNSVNSSELKPKKFAYARFHKPLSEGSVSATVPRQGLDSSIDGTLIGTSKPVIHRESENQNPHSVTCAPRLCNTDPLTRTNSYNSVHKHNQSDLKKTEADSPEEMLEQQVITSQQSMQEGTDAMSIIMEVSSIDDTSLSNSSGDEYSDNCVKKVTWADSADSTPYRAKQDDSYGNGLQLRGSDLDQVSPKSIKSCETLKINKFMQASPSKTHVNKTNTTDLQKNAQSHLNSNPPQNSKADTSSKSEPPHEVGKQNELLCSIDSLAPDKLVSVVFKDRSHPMAKLIIGNMIGLENQESAILTAYKTLSSNYEKQEISKKSKDNKLRSKFLLKNRAKKNGMLSKHRREIANLMIDAKFDTMRGSRASRLRTSKIRIRKSESFQRKLVGSRRIPSSSKIINKDIRNSIRSNQIIKPDDNRIDEISGAKKPQMASKSVQCSTLTMPSVDQSSQVDDSFFRVSPQDRRMKIHFTDFGETEAECSKTKKVKGANPEFSNHSHHANSGGSAFVPVNTLNCSDRIARLRSIGFKPIGTCSPSEDDLLVMESPRTKVDEEYSKYTSEDSDVVSYMQEHLHFEDIEDEDRNAVCRKRAESQSLDELFSKPVETLTEKDFRDPWHGWKRVSVNGKSYWTGY